LGVYPASVELRDSGIYSLSSRTVAAVGVADEIEAAREISLTGVRTIENEGFRYRSDIASREHIRKSIEHMEKIRH
jgi:phosphoribosylamine-glycine ligase